jgi:hypothetical protein
MNERPVTQDVVFTMDVEYIPTLSPDFRPVDAVWLDVTGSCGESDVKVTSKQMELNSPPTQLDFGGKIIMAGGHIHDGSLPTDHEGADDSRWHSVHDQTK